MSELKKIMRTLVLKNDYIYIYMGVLNFLSVNKQVDIKYYKLEIHLLAIYIISYNKFIFVIRFLSSTLQNGKASN